jgi:hypothetical protein
LPLVSVSSRRATRPSMYPLSAARAGIRGGRQLLTARCGCQVGRPCTAQQNGQPGAGWGMDRLMLMVRGCHDSDAGQHSALGSVYPSKFLVAAL